MRGRKNNNLETLEKGCENEFERIDHLQKQIAFKKREADALSLVD